METVKPIPTDATAKTGARLAPPAEGAFHETRSGWLVLAIVWTASVAYLGVHLRQGWVPSDAGILAEMAERVLRGQLPHRDFIEVYTGGLTYLDALAFRLFGVNFFSLRIPLFLFFLGWVPSVYFIARRFARPVAAGAITLLAVAWSVPNYPEGMPSWYNLFFATWGVLALFRYTETNRKRWLWVAGLCAGLSFLVKISGLYLVAAAFLFFVYREASSAEDTPKHSDRHALPYQLFVTAGLLLYLTSLTVLVSARPTTTEYIHFVLPSACLVLFLLREAWHGPSAGSLPRFRRLLSMGLPFLGGVLIPVAIFLLWYASQGAVEVWWMGTFVGPTIRTHWEGWDAFSPTAGLLGLLPVLLILVAAYGARTFARRLVQVGAPLVLAGSLLAAWKSLSGYIFVGYSASLAVPLLGLATPFVLRRSAKVGNRLREQVFLVVVVAVLCALIQFPTAGTIYFCYVAPLEIMGVLALASPYAPMSRLALGSLVAFYLIFAVWLHTPGFFSVVRVVPGQPVSLRTLSLPRGGRLRALPADVREYEALVRLVQAHARGKYIYAAPDIPEIYFLSGHENPTPTSADFLDPDFLEPSERSQRILALIERDEVNLVVLGKDSKFSGPIPAELRAGLDARYPQSAKVGDFEVRWEDLGTRTAPTADPPPFGR